MTTTDNDLAALERELIDRARALVPTLKSRAPGSEAARSLSKDTIDDFRKAGFFKVLQPTEYGGYEMRPLTLCRLLFEVGRGDMSAGWVLFVLALHPYGVRLAGEACCRAIWGTNPDALVASSVAPFGQVDAADGGYQVNGRWRFSSGIDHADWVGVGGLAPAADGKGKDFRMSFVRTRDVRIDQDSWKTFGLSGTGSKDLDIAPVFVPKGESFSLMDAGKLALGQESMPRAYRYPFWTVFNAAVGAAIIGGANGAVDEAVEQMGGRVGSADTGNGKMVVGDDPFVQHRIGRARVMMRGAMARYTAIFAEMDDYIDRGEPVPVAQRMHYLSEFAQCARDCEEVVLTLYKTTGGRGLALENPMQSVLRNVLAGANHIAMNLDPTYRNLGMQLLGREHPPVPC